MLNADILNTFFQLSGSQLGGDLVPQEIFGDVWRHVWLSALGRGRMLLASSVWEASGAAKHVAVHTRSCQTKHYLALNFNRATLEKAFPKITDKEEVSAFAISVQHCTADPSQCSKLRKKTKKKKIWKDEIMLFTLQTIWLYDYIKKILSRESIVKITRIIKNM